MSTRAHGRISVVSTVVIRAAGAVLWRRAEAGVEVAVIHRGRRQDWSLPKGKLDAGEDEETAAVREVEEETGFSGALGEGLGTVRYRVRRNGRRVDKTVRYWEMEAASGSFTPNREVDELCWLPPAKALETVTYDRDREVLQRFLETVR